MASTARFFIRTAGRIGVVLMIAGSGTALAQANVILSTTVPYPVIIGIGSVGGRILFSLGAGDGSPTTQNLWSSDGTAPGSTMIANVNAHMMSRPCNGLLYFLGDVSAPSTFVTSLWRTDGTEAGTLVLSDVRPSGQAPVSGELACVNGLLVFNRPNDMWASDGTVAGTKLMKPGVTGNFAEAGGLAFFSRVEGLGLIAIWRTDGTPAGMFKVREVAPFENGELIPAGERVFVRSCFGSPCTLSLEDGTVGGNTFVATVPSPLSNFDALYAFGRLYFVACPGSGATTDCEPWVSDGTPAGTHLLKQIGGPSGASPHGFTEAFGKVFFSADDGVHGVELWVSNGTAAGTTMFADLATGAPSSNPGGFFFWRKRLFFVADDGASGKEPWVSDGTPAGTALFQDVAPGSPSSTPRPFVSAGDFLMFWASPSAGTGDLYSLAASAAPVSGSGFVTVPPCRAVDTRRAGVALAANSTGVFRLGGACGVPRTATAVAGNIVTAASTGDGTLRVDSVTQATPASVLSSFRGGRTRANNAVFRLVGSPDIAIRNDMPFDPSGSVHVVVDVSGYFE